MDGGNSRLGSAQVRWNDYVGTAAADDADALLATRSLYAIAGLDRERWMIMGLDLALGEAAGVIIYAADRTDDARAPDAQEVAVTAFRLVSSTQLDEFLAEAFQRVSVRLMVSTARDKELLVVDQAELSDSPAHPA